MGNSFKVADGKPCRLSIQGGKSTFTMAWLGKTAARKGICPIKNDCNLLCECNWAWMRDPRPILFSVEEKRLAVLTSYPG